MVTRARKKGIVITQNTLTGKIVDTTGRTDGSVIYWDDPEDKYKHAPIDPATGVPYSGSILDVDLGTHSLTTESIVFNDTPTVTPADREMFWDVDNDTISFQVPDGGMIQINQEPFDYYTCLEAGGVVNGDIVSVVGVGSAKTAIQLTDSTDDALSLACIGMVTVPSIAFNNIGRVTKSGGKIRNLNTFAYNEGDVLYVDPLNPGKWTATKPNAPYRAIRIGVVDVKSTTVGVVDLNLHVEAKLTELADVNGTPLTTTGQILVYNQSTGVFDFNYNVLHLPTLKIGGVSNYTEFEADGTMKLVGNATVFDDLLPHSVTVGAGASAPSFTAFNGNLKAYEFVGATTLKELNMSFQIPHSYKEGSDIVPHVHLHIPDDVTGGTIKFYFEYNWTNVDQTGVVATTTISGTTVRTPSQGINTNSKLIFPAITGTGKTISSIISCRIYRDPTDVADTFAASVWMKAADLHYEKDTIGSRTTLVK